jgi:hypothetical protein
MRETITLGERRFEIRPLKLGQLRRLLDALEAMAGKSGGGLVAAAAEIVAAGLAPSYPEVTAETLLDLEAGLDDLNAAVAAILRAAGLRPAEGAPGEARPVASPGLRPATSSAPSMAPSPPAAATPTP